MENVLFDKEKALLPEAQLDVEEKNRRKHVMEKIKEIDRDIQMLERKRKELEREYNGNVTAEKKERIEFVRQCPAEGCRGFLSTQWKCGICELWTCPDCHELKGESRDCEHTCDPSNLETARLLEKDSKPCPSCHSLIFKISGCNQMWCTMCNTAFCWATGRIEKTNIHNPHYFEWLRTNQNLQTTETNRVNDFGCERDLTHEDWNILYNIRIRKYPNRLVIGDRVNDVIETVDRFGYIIRNIIHLMRVEIHSFPVVDYVRSNRELRVSYLEGMCTEEEFKTEIQRRDKKNRKNIEISQVLRFVWTVTKDIVFRFIDDIRKNDQPEFDAIPYSREIDGLVEHSNELLRDISHTYNCVKYRFGEHLQFLRGDGK
jgi:hypothetical protein